MKLVHALIFAFAAVAGKISNFQREYKRACKIKTLKLSYSIINSKCTIWILHGWRANSD